MTENLIHLYNPLPDDFSYEWFDNGDTAHMLTIRAGELKAFPESQGKFLAKHLADMICLNKGIKNHLEEWKKVYDSLLINDFN